jgi:NADPH:quinone reductase-like Zn-dependent oxidoreductase
MQAVVRERYGGPEVLGLREVEKPALAEDGVLVRVRATSLNRSDWHALTGRPWVGRAASGIARPRSRLIGGDFAGVAEEVGSAVTGVEPGDEVYGCRTGALAEYVCARMAVVRKPANLTDEEAAAVPVAALTALQGLRDHGGLQPGERVLVQGASGGVGTFAVQIAKALGAEVHAVTGTPNVELARSLGAERVFDYMREDFARSGERYDLFLDIAGTRSWRTIRRVLAPGGRVVLIGGPKDNRLFAALGHVLVTKAAIPSAAFFVAKPNKPDLETIRDLIEDARVRPVVDRTYPLREIADAMRYLGDGHPRGKVVLTL